MRTCATIVFSVALALPGARAAAVPARPPDFHVATTGSDSADGSADHPWRTLQRAADAVVPGATVHVAPGRYESGRIEARVSGRADARIRFVSDSTWGARIFVAPVRQYHIAWRQTGAFTDIVGFDVSGDGFTGIDVAADEVRVLRNRVHDFPNAGSRGSAGIVVEDSRAALVEANVVFAIGRPDSSNGLVHGIYLSRGARGARVRNNLVYGNQDAGICSYHTAEADTIVNNTVFANGNWGIQIGGANGSYADSFLVANNIVFDNGGVGLAELGLSGTHNRFVDNLVYRNRSAFDIRTSPPPRGTVIADPRFVRYRRDGAGDYHLARGSPCVDAGAALGAPAADFDGAPRPKGHAVDLGAFECW